jgi:aquaglyceroporin related protein
MNSCPHPYHAQETNSYQQTFLYVFLGICGNLSVMTSNSQYGTYETRSWAWGLSVMVAIYVGGGISGAHLNPCISVSLSLFRGFPWKLCGLYIIAQFLGGFCGGGLAYLIYHDAIHYADPGLTQELTGLAFYTAPQSFVSVSSAFFNEFIASAVLVCVVFALGDDQNSPPGPGMNALVLGLVAYLIMITLGYNTGPAVSPARDLGPRLIALAAGYGRQTFTTGWWAYGVVGGDFAGMLAGAFLYDSLVFVGGESPVNYHWTDVKWRAVRGKERVKGMAGLGGEDV